MALLDSIFGRLPNLAAQAPTQLTFVSSVPDPGLGIAGEAIEADECYIEVYLESFRLELARKWTTTFDPVVYVFAGMARDGLEPAKLAAVSKPAELEGLDPGGLGKVIVAERRLLGPTPWRGGPLDLQLGLFSLKRSDVLTPWLDYVTKVAEKGGASFVGPARPFVDLIGEGLGLLAGQKSECAIEVGLATSMLLETSRICAIVDVPSGTLDPKKISLDRDQRTLRHDGQPLNAGYCVFSIRCTKEKSYFGSIPELRAGIAELKRTLKEFDGENRKPVEDAYTAYRRETVLSPDLIPADAQRLAAKAKTQLVDPILSGSQPISREGGRVNLDRIDLNDLDLYDQG